MRITHVLFNMITGGTETLLIDILRCQAESGHDVSLLLINDRHDQALLATVDPRIHVSILGKPQGTRWPGWLLRFNLRLRQLKPDVVHVHNERALGMLMGPRRFPLVFTYHGLGYTNPWASKPDLSVGVSQAVADDILARGILADASRLAVVPNGIRAEAISRRPEGPAHTPVRLLQVGRLEHNAKGQDLTLDALAMLPRGRYALSFVGDGPSRPLLEEKAQRLGLADEVTFAGTLGRSDVYRMMKDHDMALMTSRSEGFGLTLAEAAAAGLPIVTCDLPGPLEVVDGGRLARTFATGDTAALARAIEDTAADWKAATGRAAEARAFATGRFGIATTARRYLELYAGLAAKS